MHQPDPVTDFGSLPLPNKLVASHLVLNTGQHHEHGSDGYIPPIPAVDAAECWVPLDLGPVQEVSMPELRQMLEDFQRRLDTRFEDLFRRLGEEPSCWKTEEPSCWKTEEPSCWKTEEPSCWKTEETTRKVAEEPMRSEETVKNQESGIFNSGKRQSRRKSSASSSSYLRPSFRRDMSRDMSYDMSEAAKKDFVTEIENQLAAAGVAPRESTTSAQLPVGGIEGFRRFLRELLERNVTEAVLCTIILSYVVTLGLEVQALLDTPAGEMPHVYEVLEHVYRVVFVAELVVRIFAHGCREFFRGVNRLWNVMDLVLVLSSLAEIGVAALSSNNPELGYLGTIRMAKTLRIVRIVRIVKFFRPLRILLYSVANTVRNLGWMLVMIFLIFYSFGVTFSFAAAHEKKAELSAAEREEVELFFGSLFASVMCLFKATTGGIDWSDAADTLAMIDESWALLFCGYVIFANLAVLNVVTGVVCQTAIETASQDHDIVMQAKLADKRRYVKQLQDLFQKCDAEHNGKITLQEFEARLQDTRLQTYFDAMELTVDEAWNLFKLLDCGNTGCIQTADFVAGCLRLRGQAKSIDMHMLMYQSKWSMDRLATLASAVESLAHEIKAYHKEAKLDDDDTPSCPSPVP